MRKEIDIEELKRELYRQDALRDKDDLQCAEVDRIEPKYYDGDLSALGLSPKVTDAVRKELNGKQLYQHQANAIRASMQGDNVILESPTASGKTLSFAAPMLGNVCGGGTALMVYPMKAVAHDQERQLQICDSLRIEYSPFHGGMKPAERRAVWKKHPNKRILFTTPETLHNNFLWWSEHHVEFLKRLSFLVLDEAHEYRGYFGNHMAEIVRRLLAKVNQMGARPKIFVATATCANPLQHAESLTGQEFRHVPAGNVLRPRRHFMFVNPHPQDFEFKKNIVNAAMACLQLRHSVLVFCRSVAFVGQAEIDAKKAAKNAGLKSAEIAGFHAGLSSDEKDRVLRGMQDGSLRVVFCTKALELGIDVPGLDGVILAGFPDNIAAARQRIGRAGRSWDSDAFVLYYPENKPLDKFVAADVQAFLRRTLDPVVIDPENDEAIDKHAPCAREELGLTLAVDDDSAKESMGAKFYEKAARSNDDVESSYDWINLNMRGGSHSYKLKLASDKCEIGSISGTRQFREAYIGAVLVQNGVVYKVERVDHGKHIVFLALESRNVRTLPKIKTKIPVGKFYVLKRSERVWGAACLHTINIGMQLDDYKLLDGESGEVLEFRKNDKGQYAPKVFMNKRHSFVMNVSSTADTGGVVVRSLGHIMRVGALFVVSADWNDISTWSEGGTLYLYENYPGGIGVARQIFDQWKEIMAKGIEMAENCQECKRRKTPKGCAACILPSFNTGDMDKRAGIILARSILKLEDGGDNAE